MTTFAPSSATSLVEPPRAYHFVRRRLLAELGTRWHVGERLPPIAHLARALQSGQRNTHRAVQTLVAEGLLSTRAGSGTYVLRVAPAELPHTAAPLPLQGKTIAVLRHVGQEEALIMQMGARASTSLTAAGARVEMHIVERLGNGNYDLTSLPHDGAVLVNPGYTKQIVVPATMKLVVISTHALQPAQAAAGFDVVAADAQQGSFLAGKACRDAGVPSVCFVGVGAKPERQVLELVSQQRRTGFEDGWGAPVPENLCLKATSFMISAGAKIASEYLKLSPRPAVVFAASDEIAMGFRLGMMTAGLDAGADYQLIGFDGQLAARNSPDGPLATVAVPAEEMGRTAAELLTERFANPQRPARRIYVDCHFLPGHTFRTS